MTTFTRLETVSVLGSLGLELPPNTKLSDEMLEKRLRDALNAAQQKHRLPALLDLKSLSPWPTSNSAQPPSKKKPLLDAIKRGNIGEAAYNYARGSQKTVLYVDPFMDLRQTIMGFAYWIDQGVTRCTIQDQEKENCAINVRVRRATSRVVHTLLTRCNHYPTVHLCARGGREDSCDCGALPRI